jgi:undecaprenyl-diphosphatase
VEGPVDAGPTALAAAVDFVVGCGVIIAFIKLVSTRSCMVFVGYRVRLGLLVLALLQLGLLSAL